MTSFEDLDVWRRSCDLAVQVCTAFKSCYDRGLRDQVTRSAVSVPSNIAEGAERFSRKEFAQFLGYAKGSAGELRTQIIIAARLGHISEQHSREWQRELREISAMIYGLAKSIET
jgi:four helix bundle protein